MIYIFYPETSGRTLEELDIIFSKTPIWKPWEVVAIEKETPKRDFTKDVENHSQNI